VTTLQKSFSALIAINQRIPYFIQLTIEYPADAGCTTFNKKITGAPNVIS
jgi:hypothetical protein